VAQDYDAVRPEVAERSEETLKNVQSMGAPTARTVVEELDFADGSDAHDLPGAIVEDELVVAVVPQGSDEFVCPSCFTVRHRSQLVRDPAGAGQCRDCMD
jgi:hypothetical protein